MGLHVAIRARAAALTKFDAVVPLSSSAAWFRMADSQFFDKGIAIIQTACQADEAQEWEKVPHSRGSSADTVSPHPAPL